MQAKSAAELYAVSRARLYLAVSAGHATPTAPIEVGRG